MRLDEIMFEIEEGGTQAWCMLASGFNSLLVRLSEPEYYDTAITIQKIQQQCREDPTLFNVLLQRLKDLCNEPTDPAFHNINDSAITLYMYILFGVDRGKVWCIIKRFDPIWPSLDNTFWAKDMAKYLNGLCR